MELIQNIHQWIIANPVLAALFLGVLPFVFTNRLLVPILRCTRMARKIERNGGEAREVPNADLIRQLGYVACFFAGLWIVWVLYQVQISSVFSGNWGAVMSGAIIAILNVAVLPNIMATWQIAFTQRLLPGNSLTVCGEHCVFVRASMMSVTLHNPRAPVGCDYMTVPVREFVSSAVMNHGPYGRAETVQFQIVSSSVQGGLLDGLLEQVEQILSDEELLYREKVVLSDQFMLTIQMRSLSTVCADRDEMYRTAFIRFVDVIHELGLEIHDQNQ